MDATDVARELLRLWNKSEETYMRSLITFSIVVLLKIEQQLSRGLAKHAVPQRHRTRTLRQ